MISWKEFIHLQPELAKFGIERFSTRVAYLATIRKDGGPRVHPVTPVLSKNHLFIFMDKTSPKGQDLQRDNRFALHSLVTNSDGGKGEFRLRGRATLIIDEELRSEALIASGYRPEVAKKYILFELLVSMVGTTVYQNGNPENRLWRYKKTVQ